MRKYIMLVAALFVVAVGVGFVATPQADAGLCYYTCDCAGNPLYCCITPWGTSCKPTDVWACPQIYRC